MRCRVVVATHPAIQKKSPVGVTRAGIVHELFFTTLPQHAFTEAFVVELYLHRGAFESTRSDEDREIDPDRWCSHSAWGQECWQVVAQWTRNLRLELGHQLHPAPLRITEFAPAIADRPESGAQWAPMQGYGAPTVAWPWKVGRFCGQDFTLQPAGVLLCPAGKTLHPTERRWEANGSLRVLYSARIRDCRPCSVRPHCQWQGEATANRVGSVSCSIRSRLALHRSVFRDWSRGEHRRACQHLLRDQQVEVNRPPIPPPVEARPCTAKELLSRAQRAHTRLSWKTRVARNARRGPAGQVTITLFGVPNDFAAWLGLTADESARDLTSAPKRERRRVCTQAVNQAPAG